MNHQYISIGIPIYNAEKFLDYAITSVLAQTHQNWELILIDDGSTDRSLEIAKKYEALDSRIKVISDGLNKKLPARLNQLIDESKYDYIARMDADDMMHPKRLETQLKFLENNPQFDLVSTGLISIDAGNKAYNYRHVPILLTRFPDPLKKYPITHPSVFAKKSWYLRNKYSTQYPRCEDFELWCRAISNQDFNMAVLPDLLLYYREEGNIDATKMINSYNDNFRVYTKYSGGFSIKRFFSLTVKKGIVIALDKVGKLQALSKLRNKQSPSIVLIKEHQEIINKIINMTA